MKNPDWAVKSTMGGNQLERVKVQEKMGRLQKKAR